MKENFEVDINKLTEEEKKKFLELVKKGNEPIIRKRWRGEENDTYYYFSGSYRLIDTVESEDNYDDNNYQFGNYFKTKEEAEFAIKKRLIYQQLSDYALEHNTDEIDWTDKYSRKFYIAYTYTSDNLFIDYTQTVKYPNTVYFTSEKIAENAIEEIGGDKIKYYLFGIED